MTRKEEIEKSAQKCKWISQSLNLQSAFTEGAEWADKTMLDRACEWLKENIDLYSYNAFNVKSGYTETILTDEFETAFRQAMMEGE